MDNGLDSLVYFARYQCPDLLANFEFETFRDIYRSTKAGPMVK